MLDQQSKKSLLYGVGAGVGVITIGAVFILGAVYGPEIRARFSGIAAKASTGSNIAGNKTTNPVTVADPNAGKLTEAVVPSSGAELPVTWGDLGKRLVEKGVIDRTQFTYLYKERLGFGPAEQKLLDEGGNGKIKITPDNAGFMLNMFWALGLGNKNLILDTGPMVDKRYNGAGNFASTGGWTLSKGKAMTHYSKYEFIKLNKDQQALVEKVSQGIFRPCCNNSTYFPDCNHGMAMLGLLELMASQNISEAEMYKVALQVNSYWFPDTYLTLAKYEASKGTAWKNVDPKQMLSAEFSSAGGYRAIKSQVAPVQGGGGGGCGV